MMLDMLLTSSILCVLQSFGAFGFNIDLGSAVVFDGPVKSKYFGYSVALHQSVSNYWAMVGAPLSNVSTGIGVDRIRYGAVYRCPYPKGPCNVIDIDSRPVRMEQGHIIEEKDGQWLGGTIYSTGKDNHKALACAPRYIHRGVPVSTSKGDVHFRWLLGRCFRLTPDLDGVEQSGGILDPCLSEKHGNNYYGYCQAGFSAKYTDEKVDPDLIMGTVGTANWKGGMITYTENKFLKSSQDQIAFQDYMGYDVATGKFSDKIRTELVGGAPRAVEMKGKALIYGISDTNLVVKSPLPQPKDLKVGSYFGSVLCGVDLNDDQFTDLLVGAPYYTHVKDEGRVYIYLNNGQGALNLHTTVLEGDKQVDAHFGQAIASVGDLNGDGFQDVAIGAPMEDGSGAVYIYHGSKNGIELPYNQKILGSKVSPGFKMFGISISRGVDVDKNRYPDIAVGAYGSEQAVILRSRTVVNVKGVITLSKQQIILESNDSLCDLEGAKLMCLNVTVDLFYEDQIPETNSKDLHMKYQVELDKDKNIELRRMFFWDAVNKKRLSVFETNYTLALPKKNYKMQPKTVYLMDKSEIGDVSSLLTFDLNLLQPQPPCSDLCPLLNEQKPKVVRAEIPFQKKCKDRVCVPDLVLSGKVVFTSKSEVQDLRLGVVKDFTVQLEVKNVAEDSAYTSTIKLKHPDTLNYIGPDQGVQCDRSPPDNGTVTVTCDVGNPLAGKASKSFGIKFTPGNVRKDFVLVVEASSQDKDANIKDNKKSFPVTVKFEADVEIIGSSKQDRVVYEGPVREEAEIKKSLDSIGPEVVQTLSVRNKGPSEVDGSVVSVQFPNLYSSSKPESYLLYLLLVEIDGSASGSCKAKVNPLGIKESNDTTGQDNTQSRKRRDTGENTLLGCRTASCQSFDCNLGLLKMGDKVNIKLTFRLWENTLLKELKTPEAVDLETTGKVKVPDEITQPDNNNDETTIITTASPAQTESQEKKTPWWVIFLSVLGGVLLLAGAIVVLYKVGFFKRKKIKEISEPDSTELTVT